MASPIDEFIRALRIEAETISSLEEDTNFESILMVIPALEKCTGKIIISGCGTSSMAAKKIAHSLCCIERPALFLSPSDAVHGALGVLLRDDILVLISKGGKTKELEPLSYVCKQKAALLIVVSETSESTIGRNADVFLQIKVKSEPCKYNILATASTLAVLAIFDAICIALMSTTAYSIKQFSTIHPSGAVGERLLEEK